MSNLESNSTSVLPELHARFGPGSSWKPDQLPAATAWPLQQFDLVWASEARQDSQIRALWRARSAGGAKPVVVLAPGSGKVRVLGPQDPQAPIRSLPLEPLLRLLEEAQPLARRQAASLLAAEFLRLDESGIPGVGIHGLLTRHFFDVWLRRQENWRALAEAASSVNPSHGWQENLRALGYRLEQTKTGYLLRSGEEPIAIVHAYPDPTLFSQATSQGSLPEGAVLAECQHHGATWGILATPRRFRLFQADPPVGSATARYLELDLREISPEDRPYAGLLSPLALKRGGLLEQWIAECRQFGEELREKIEERLRLDALPSFAQGLGAYLEAREGADLTNPEVLRQIEEAALTFLFRVIFVLYAEAASYLPVASDAYRPHSATEFCASARRHLQRADPKASTLWNELRTLVHMVRTGDKARGVPAYNGSLFAASGFPGSELLERADVKDPYMARALSAIAYAKDDPDEPGLDYAELEIGHLGAIYEGLLGLRLTYARESMRYDEKADRYLPARAGDTAVVEKAQLFYQTESGGRKAAGVYYTRQEFVRHLINHSLVPALKAHLEKVAQVATGDPAKASRLLFDFMVVDPAMGSAHFLADALNVMADRLEHFLADHPLPTIREHLDALKADADGGVGRVYEDGQLLRRLILKRCIFGVDLSPMAVEVANISLWLASFVPGLALSYLGSNLKVGDALMGVADLTVLRQTSPLFFSLENPGSPLAQAMGRAAEAFAALQEIGDRSPEEVEQSREKERELQAAIAGMWRCMDLWCAEPLGVTGARHLLETETETVLQGRASVNAARVLSAATQESQRRRFFHWPLAFPQVFLREQRGFDAVIGNPPWNEVTVEELAFYALHDPGLRGLVQEEDRRTRMEEIDRQYPQLRKEFGQRRDDLAVQRRFFSTAGGYQLQSGGDPDLYQLFCERYGHLTREAGWLGVVLPRSAFLVEGGRGFRRWLFKETTVRRIDFLLNNRSWAFPIHPQYTIALVAAQRRPADAEAELRLTGPSASLEAFQQASQSPGVAVALKELREWTPTPPDDPNKEPSWEMPLLPSPAAAALFAKLRQGPRFDQGYTAVWKAFQVRELDETNDKKFFKYTSGIPVWKGRSFDQYDPHGADPAGYARARELEAHLQQKRLSARSQFRRHFPEKLLKDVRTLPLHQSRIAFRDVTNRTNSRTVIACLIPPDEGLTNKAPYLVFPIGNALAQCFILGVLNSLPFDWQARRLVEMNVNFFILDMLCFPPPERTPWERIGKLAARLSCVDDRFAQFARQAGVECGPVDDRVGLRAEMDALVAHAYGLSEADLYTMFQDFTEAAVSPAYRERLVERFKELSGAGR